LPRLNVTKTFRYSWNTLTAWVGDIHFTLVGFKGFTYSLWGRLRILFGLHPDYCNTGITSLKSTFYTSESGGRSLKTRKHSLVYVDIPMWVLHQEVL